jgi:hypothetical protein
MYGKLRRIAMSKILMYCLPPTIKTIPSMSFVEQLLDIKAKELFR